jgi:Cytochrome c554 and c-prime
MTRMGLRGLVPLALAAALTISGTARAAVPTDNVKHLGVASCAGNNCHGAVKPVRGSSVQQNEYLIWAQKDKHRLAYAALTKPLGLRIAHNLGLPDAVSAPLCLNCHADNVPPDRRGPQFQLSDGVGCEACHGGAEKWLGVHISGATHQQDIAAGMYPTDQPVARAERCLSCHFGDPTDDQRFVTHRIMGAGHPRMGFELDTYTYAQPAHFVVDKSYIARKGKPNDAQIWAVGQAVDLEQRMAALMSPRHAPKGVQPELVLFDCQACHHAMNQLQWSPGTAGMSKPGQIALYDANAVMLRVIFARVAPAAAKAFDDHMMALHRALDDNWPAVQQAAGAVRQAVNQVIPALMSHDFSHDDMTALAAGVVVLGEGGTSYSDAEQETMALGSLAAGMKAWGYINDTQAKAMNGGLDGLYKAIVDDQTYRPADFARAMRDYQKTMSH